MKYFPKYKSCHELLTQTGFSLLGVTSYEKKIGNTPGRLHAMTHEGHINLHWDIQLEKTHRTKTQHKNVKKHIVLFEQLDTSSSLLRRALDRIKKLI